MEHFGIELHQTHSDVCGLSEHGEKIFEKRIATTESLLRRVFGKRSRCRIIIECSCLVPWVGRLLRELGHQVVVVNPRRIRLIAESTLKSDRMDAEILALDGMTGARHFF